MIVYHTPDGKILRWSSSGMGDIPGLTALETDVSDPTDCRVVAGEVVPLPPRPDGFVTFDYAAGAWVPDDALAEAEARRKRQARLAVDDWIVTRATEQGEEISPELKAYRQALRDVTRQPGFPHSIIWPAPPR